MVCSCFSYSLFPFWTNTEARVVQISYSERKRLVFCWFLLQHFIILCLMTAVRLYATLQKLNKLTVCVLRNTTWCLQDPTTILPSVLLLFLQSSKQSVFYYRYKYIQLCRKVSKFKFKLCWRYTTSPTNTASQFLKDNTFYEISAGSHPVGGLPLA